MKDGVVFYNKENRISRVAPALTAVHKIFIRGEKQRNLKRQMNPNDNWHVLMFYVFLLWDHAASPNPQTHAVRPNDRAKKKNTHVPPRTEDVTGD